MLLAPLRTSHSQKHMKLPCDDNDDHLMIGGEVKIMHTVDRNNNNGRCGYVVGATPQYVHLVLYQTHGVPQDIIPKMRQSVLSILSPFPWIAAFPPSHPTTLSNDSLTKLVGV